MPAATTSDPVGQSRVLPAGACARRRADLATDLQRDPPKAAHGNPAPLSAHLRTRRSGTHAAPFHDGHHLPARHKHEARYFLGPIHTSYVSTLIVSILQPDFRPAGQPRRLSPQASWSSHVRQCTTQLLRGAEESVLGGLFRRMQNLSYGSQLQSVIVLQLENHPLAGRKLVQGSSNAGSELSPHSVFFRIGSGPRIWDLIEHIVLATI